MQVEIYSDVVCPWCYIGERRFARALESFPGRDDVHIVFRPYQLDPGAPSTARPLIDSLREKFDSNVRAMLARVSEAAKGEGIEIDWDDAVAVNTLTAHRLLRLAEREYGADLQRALAERLFEAHFTRGGNVADPGLLTTLAVAVGMNRERVERYLLSGEGLAETQHEIERARELGVRAVPTFVFDGQYLVEGGQPPETFIAVLNEVATRSAEGASA
jgi:predicted DsbA family dithiol-disulfide isomerase